MVPSGCGSFTAAPPFTIHVGDEAKGEFAGRQFHWRVPGEIGFEIVRQMYAQGFDPAQVRDPLYLRGEKGYQKLTKPLLAKVLDGEVRV